MITKESVKQARAIFEMLFSDTFRGREGSEQLRWYLEDGGFYEAPASAKYHLAEPGGLVVHTYKDAPGGTGSARQKGENVERRRRTSKEILRAQKWRNFVGRAARAAAAVLILLVVVYGIAPVRAAGTDVPEDIQTAAEVIGQQYCICPEFLEAIAYRESGYDPGASGGGCVGLMQIAPKWHRARMERLGVSEEDLTDAYANMLVAADYLSELFEKYEDPGMVLMVYNGDSNAAAYYDGTAELSEYAEKILSLSEQLERTHGK